MEFILGDETIPVGVKVIDHLPDEGFSVGGTVKEKVSHFIIKHEKMGHTK